MVLFEVVLYTDAPPCEDVLVVLVIVDSLI